MLFHLYHLTTRFLHPRYFGWYIAPLCIIAAQETDRLIIFFSSNLTMKVTPPLTYDILQRRKYGEGATS